MEWTTVTQLAVAIGLGLLVGFQRERTAPHVAGIRSFALVTMLGCVLGLFVDRIGAWVPAVGLLVIGAVTVVGNFVKLRQGKGDTGITTQVAVLVMYGVGVAAGLQWFAVAFIVAGTTAVLLQWKQPLHALVDRIGDRDFRAIIQLVLIGLIILPVLPNQDVGPYGVLNPFEIWLVVVLIVGISLAGYIGYRFLSPRAGALMGGVIGGLISSTATTVSYSRQMKSNPKGSRIAAIVIVIASAIGYARVLVEVAIVSPELIWSIAPPLLALMGLMGVIGAVQFRTLPKAFEKAELEKDPGQLGAAVIFGILYAAVLFGLALAKDHLGERGLYLVAFLSGLTDMDAITLSSAQMIRRDQIPADLGWRLIIVGSLSNLLFKAGVVAVLGNRVILTRVLVAFGAVWVAGLALVLFWR